MFVGLVIFNFIFWEIEKMERLRFVKNVTLSHYNTPEN